MHMAFKTAAECGKEWEDEARKQALVIANLNSNGNAESTLDKIHSSALINATDKLEEVIALAYFIQSVSVNTPPDRALTLQPNQLSGFFYIMESAIDGMKEVSDFIDVARSQPKAAHI